MVTPSNSHAILKMVLHWTLAAAILFLFVSSWWMLSLPLPSDDYTYRVVPFQLHKNIGITLFLIILVMICLRWVRRLQQNAAARSALQTLADIDQWLIYALVAACCSSGYLSSSYSGWNTEFWWLIQLPAWARENDGLNILFSDLHQWSCWLLLLAIVLHIAAAIYHGLRDDALLPKMFP